MTTTRRFGMVPPLSVRLRSLLDFPALLDEDAAQQRAMAARLVLAVAADGKIYMVRQLRQHVGRAACVGPRHFGSVLLRESRPLGRCLRRQGELHRRQARRERREPNVVIVAGGKTPPFHAPPAGPARVASPP